MSYANLQSGIVLTLTACGPYAASEISTCSFAPLEAVSGCAVIIMPIGDTPTDPNRFGALNQVNLAPDWEATGYVYVKDTGQGESTLGRIWQAYDDIFTTLKKDNSLQGKFGVNGYARLVGVGWNGLWTQTGGGLWAPVKFKVRAMEV